MELLLRGESLGLAADLRCEYALAPLESTLEVIHIMEEKYGEFSRLRITFSDDLAAGRDYRGYLHISPAVDFTVEAVGRELIIAGDFRPREKYSIEFFPGLESSGGKKLNDAGDYFWEVQIADLKPAVEFIDGGACCCPPLRRKKSPFAP